MSACRHLLLLLLPLLLLGSRLAGQLKWNISEDGRVALCCCCYIVDAVGGFSLLLVPLLLKLELELELELVPAQLQRLTFGYN